MTIGFTKFFNQSFHGQGGKLPDRLDTHLLKVCFGLWPHSPEFSGRQRPDPLLNLVLGNDSQPIRLLQIGSDLCEKLVWGYPYGTTETGLFLAPSFDLPCDFIGSPFNGRDVEESFVTPPLFH